MWEAEISQLQERWSIQKSLAKTDRRYVRTQHEGDGKCKHCGQGHNTGLVHKQCNGNNKDPLYLWIDYGNGAIMCEQCNKESNANNKIVCYNDNCKKELTGSHIIWIRE